MENTYQNFINDCWANHDKKSEEVAKSLKENINLLDSPEKVPGYVSLITHTLGGHLGKWREAKDLLLTLLEIPTFENNQSITRGLATMSYCMDDREGFKKYLELSTEQGSEVRILAMAATELTGQGKISEATRAFELALNSTLPNLSKANPEARALAICGNNLACELEEKENRSTEEVDLMIKAAKAARKYWEIAGGWMEVDRAEYRLAMSFFKAGQLEKALEHARLCENICRENNADSFELFFAHEALAKINLALCVDLKSKVKEKWQSYCVIPTV